LALGQLFAAVFLGIRVQQLLRRRIAGVI
jgi:hypothetical protein